MNHVVGPTPEIEDLVNDPNFDINQYYGFVYLTVHVPTGRQYIGKKNFILTSHKKLGKKELKAIPITRGRRPTKKKTVKESDWKTYYGSSEEIKALPKEELKRYLMRLCHSSKELSYYECKYQFQYGVLEDQERWINSNILGKFYPKDLEV